MITERKVTVYYVDTKEQLINIDRSLKDLTYVEDLMYDILDDLGVGPIYRHIFGIKVTNKKTSCWLAPNTKVELLLTDLSSQLSGDSMTSLNYINLKNNSTNIFKFNNKLNNILPSTNENKQNNSTEDKITSDNHQNNHHVDANFTTNNIHEHTEADTSPTFELSIRFIPSSISRIRVIDETAFELLFAQMRYDYLNCRGVFGVIGKANSIAGDNFLSLIATDLLRKTVDKDCSLKEIKKLIDHGELVPKTAPSCQKPLLFCFSKHLEIDKCIKNYTQHGPKDVKLIKQAFIEHFIRHFCKDYRIETYNIKGLFLPFNPKKMMLRIVYHQSKDKSECFLQAKVAFPLGLEWTTLCDVQSICYASIHDEEVVEINRTSGRPYRMSFDSLLLARSFLSSIDGYHRMSKKWNSIHFCQEVSSPDLEFLYKNKIHGPICVNHELSQRKKMPSSFIVRRSTDNSNMYIIDANLDANLCLEVEVFSSKDKKTYTIGKSRINGTKFDINSSEKEYKDLKSLINDIQLPVNDIEMGENYKIQPYQLRHWIAPSEYDDYLLIMTCMSKSVFQKLLDSKDKNKLAINSLNELPRYIPENMLLLDNNIPPIGANFNSSIVRKARFNTEHLVIVKVYLGSKHNNIPHNVKIDDWPDRKMIICSYQGRLEDQAKERAKDNEQDYNNVRLIATEFRLIDWIFIRHPLFAETIGLTRVDEFKTHKSSIVQEFLEQRLDSYLKNNHKSMSSDTLKAICCQLACALLFLQDKRIVHGKLRCHNIYIKRIHPLLINITDPLGNINVKRDLAFIPPEYMLTGNEDIIINEFTSGFDVWSFGTVLWQIFSCGKYPPSERYANTLVKPSSCPGDVWELAETCWQVDVNMRATPQTIYRDLNDSLDWQKDSTSLHYYHSLEGQENQHLEAVDQKATHNCSPIDLAIWDQNSISSDNESSKSRKSGDNNGRNSNINNGFSTKSSDTDDTETYLVKKTIHGSYDIKDNKCPRRMSGDNITCQLPDKKNSLTLSHIREFLKRPFQHHFKSKEITSCQQEVIPFTERSGPNGSSDNTSGKSDESLLCGSPRLHHIDAEQTTKFNNQQISESSTLVTDEYIIHPENLTTIREIGRGYSGIVLKGFLRHWKGCKETVVAIKKLNLKHSSEPSFEENLMREFDLLKMLNHENIVKTLGYVKGPELKVVVEYMPLGCLLEYLRNFHNFQLANLPLFKYAKDIASGMEYLESKSIVHRDLAARNILVKSLTQVKICDFGLAQPLGKHEDVYKVKSERPLPIAWYAPEALYPCWEFSTKSDVWSYGIVLWEIFTGGCTPIYGVDQLNLREALKYQRLLKPKNCPENMYQLMHLCWAYYPKDRPSFSQICERLKTFP